MKKKIAAIVFAVGAAGAVAIPAALAHRGGGSPEQREARKAAMLEKLDTNKDGTLSDEERAAGHKARLTERFQRMDTDGDGALSFEEFEAGAKMRRGFHGKMK